MSFLLAGRENTDVIGIVAHRSRLEQAYRLKRLVGAECLVDDGNLGCEANHRRTWHHVTRPGSMWTVVLEDDAIPVTDFTGQLELALAAAPEPIVSLYRGHHVNNPEFEKHGLAAGIRADTAGAHWITSKHLLHAVAVAVKTDMVPAMLEHIERLPDRFPIDECISHWAASADIRIAYAWPSLVDHADTESVILRHHRRDKLPRPKGRVAYRTGSRDCWTSEAVTL